MAGSPRKPRRLSNVFRHGDCRVSESSFLMLTDSLLTRCGPFVILTDASPFTSGGRVHEQTSLVEREANMKARMLLVGLLLAVGTLGCVGEDPFGPTAEPKPAAETKPVADKAEPADSAEIPGPEKSASAVGAGQPATSKPPKPSRSPPSPPTARAPQRPTGPSIHLSAGVALPQSLPTGTAMAMSVDYAFAAGQLLSPPRYVWVIEPANADPVKQPVLLSESGTLQAFFTQLRPEHGPFHTHIESSDGSRLSSSVEAVMYR